MSRNRRRRPATPAEVRRLTDLLRRMADQLERDYGWLYATGYTKPHREDVDQIGDPADLMIGTPERIRHFLVRASEGLDDAFDGLVSVRFWLGRITALVDRRASAGDAQPELQTASRSDVRHAEQAQARREDRAQQSAAPWSHDEVTG